MDKIEEATLKLAKQYSQALDSMDFNKKYIVEKVFEDNKMGIEVRPVD